MVTARELKSMRSKQKAKKKKSEKAVTAGKEPNPKNTREALMAPDAEDWVASMGNEFYGLVEKGVFDLGYTKKQLLELGITASPVPCAPYYERKYGPEGECMHQKEDQDSHTRASREHAKRCALSRDFLSYSEGGHSKNPMCLDVSTQPC